MGIGPQLDLRQTTSLVMTPQLQQAIKLLQYSSQELAQFVEEELLNNPLLEKANETSDNQKDGDLDNFLGIDHQWDQEKPANPSEDGIDSSDYHDSASYLNGESNLSANDSPLDSDNYNEFEAETGDGLARESSSEMMTNPNTHDDYSASYDHSTSNASSGDNDYDPLVNASRTVNLREYIETYIGLSFSNNQDRAIALCLADLIEPTGWLNGEWKELAQQLAVAPPQIETVLRKLQEIEPAGLFARNLAECLRLQIIDRGQWDQSYSILLENLPLVANQQWERLIRLCGVKPSQLKSMITLLRSLDPKPGLQFDPPHLEGSVPDILVKRTPNNEFMVELNPDTLPKIMINEPLFRHVPLHKTNQSETRDYFSQQRQRASWLVKSLRQRADTILKVAEEIVRQQNGFFHHGVSYLRPLVLRDIAQAINMHESTVSRVTSQKYIASERGIHELKFFFTASLAGADGDRHSSHFVRARIKALIDAETPQNILSDDQIVELLSQEQIEIARRTIAKYREAMGIASSLRRKRQKLASRL